MTTEVLNNLVKTKASRWLHFYKVLFLKKSVVSIILSILKYPLLELLLMNTVYYFGYLQANQNLLPLEVENSFSRVENIWTIPVILIVHLKTPVTDNLKNFTE